jgi:hypothetical protein
MCDAGSVTLFLVVSVTGLLVLIGLVVDGGAPKRRRRSSRLLPAGQPG